MKHFLYIAQASKETTTCKIGITDNLERRLKEYNSATGHSKDNTFEYLYTCEVKDKKSAQQIEKDIKVAFPDNREDDKQEVYVYTKGIFKLYVDYIKSHKLFIKEIFIKKKEEPAQETKIIKKVAPSLEERGLSAKDILDKARRIKNDEFYTRYEDVEKELSMYDEKIWKNKTILCNCDDALEPGNRNNTSAFSQYFVDNFLKLKIKKLICIHYSGKVDLFNQGKEAYVYIRIYTGDKWHDRKDCPPGYDGSFDHPFSIKILNEEADIVCTNPPFSRMQDYWKVLMNSGKKFIIISNTANAVTTFYIPYIKNKQVWAGYNRVDWFLNPKRQLTDASGHWYTNIPLKNNPRHSLLKIIPIRKIPEQFKVYDDSKVLIVKEGYIPSDYKKPFAVSSRPILNGLLEKGYEIVLEKTYRTYVDGKKQFAKVLVQSCQNLPVLNGKTNTPGEQTDRNLENS